VGGYGFTSQVALGELVLNNIEEDGTAWGIEEFEGWEGSPASTVELTKRTRGHGSTESEAFLSHRTMSISGTVRTGYGMLSYAEDRLNAACSLAPFQLAVVEAGRIRTAEARRQDRVDFKSLPGSKTTATFSIQFVAKDPRKYGELVTDSTVLPSSTGGLTYPVTYPVTYSGVTESGVIRINNPGNTQAPVWLRIDGPIPSGGWTVTHVGKKQSLTFSTALALGAGEFVTVDMRKREVLAQGQSARSGYVTSRGWFELDPGDNDIAFSAQNYSSTALLTVATKPAWS
jgi:hypothetical protein